MKVRVQRSIAGPVLIRFGDALNGFARAMSDQDAIALCDALRRVIEAPTKKEPQGKNVVAMSVSGR